MGDARKHDGINKRTTQHLEFLDAKCRINYKMESMAVHFVFFDSDASTSSSFSNLEHMATNTSSRLLCARPHSRIPKRGNNCARACSIALKMPNTSAVRLVADEGEEDEDEDAEAALEAEAAPGALS